MNAETSEASGTAPAREVDGPEPKTRRRWRLGVVALLLVAGAVGVAFELRGEAAEGSLPDPLHDKDVPRFADGKLVISESFWDRAEISTSVVGAQHLQPVVEASGTVDFAPHRVAAVGARIFGRVLDVDVIPGARVETGTELAQVESAELGEAQATLQTLRARAKLAEADQRRKELLIREGLTSRRAIEVAAKELEAARAEERAAAQQVRSMVGGRNGGRLGQFSLTSPIDGEVVSVNVYKGQAVEPSHTAFKVADLSELWVELAVFERDLPLVSVGDYVRVQAHGEKKVMIPGVVAHVDSVLDPVTRTATVRVVVDNADRRLRVSQSVIAHIVCQNETRKVLAVDKNAVVLVDGVPTVFVVEGPGIVEPRELELGLRGDAHIEVLAGLEDGDQVVVAGAFSLKSELFR
jgi:membrane fusion protein, heavy metal efflux system